MPIPRCRRAGLISVLLPSPPPGPVRWPTALPRSGPGPPSATSPSPLTAPFSSTAPRKAQNQLYAPVRNPTSLATYLALSASSRTPLLTLWTASWCPSCRTVLPLLTDLVQSGVGQAEGGVALAPVEIDAPDMMTSTPDAESPALTYVITSVPTLLSFDASEAQTRTKVTDLRHLSDPNFLADWIRNEASRRGQRGDGAGPAFGGLGAMASALFTGLFFGRGK